MSIGYDLLALYCSQVLANIKPSNLFTISNTAYEVDKLIETWNKDFNKYGIYFQVLTKRENTSSILCFRKDLLQKFLSYEKTKCFLKNCGYDTSNIASCTRCLKDRFLEDEFPHEIGLILGYPYDDVIGFIENKGRNYLYSGYWKVYKDKEDKCKLFNLYNKIRRIYIKANSNKYKFKKLVEIDTS
ncbi:DUF3793 family protein [Anaerococcus sp. ENR0831]|uniref:DUF3793 family protein n=1 Tax=Anaerococcus martiniensis TaxID=3115615 RepID=A0ABW9M7S8_9FIRM